MRRPYSRLAAACALAVTAASITGSAFAGGNPNAPGQQKKDAEQAQTQAPATQPVPVQSQAASEQPTQSQMAPAQQYSTSSSSSSSTAHVPPGQAKKQSTASTASTSPSQQHSSGASAKHTSSTASSSHTGVKPSSTTTHWTHCTTGTAGTGVTCTASDNGHTPQTNADVSKRYGNGKTAAQIAVSRGGIGVQLTGPGNSQPHKVSVCGKPNNRSGGVDVHAVKSYSNLNCSPTHSQAQAPVAPCGSVVVATTTFTGKAHGHGQGLVHNKHMSSSTTFSVKPDSTQVCSKSSEQSSSSSAQSSNTSSSISQSANTSSSISQSSNTSSSSVSSSSQTSATHGTSVSNTAGTAAATASKPSASQGVLGASTTLKPQHAPAHHGVLGTVTQVGGSTLPFTGFPVWLAVLVALGLIGLGFALRRRGAATRI